MKAFLVGLLVLILMSVITIAGFFLVPFLLLLGFMLRWLVSLILFILAVWLIGKITLLCVELIKKSRMDTKN